MAVAELLSAAWDGAEVVLLNDLTAAGLRMREAGMADFAVITVGSGIGHKVFAAGQPLLGPAGRGGELGHLVVVDGPDAEACDCGGIGHLGSHGSGRAIVRRVLTRWANNLATAPWAEAVAASADPDAEGGRAILAALADGDPVASAVIGEAAALLGRALAGLYLGVGVERFVLVGGFARAAGEPYRQLVATAAAASCWDLGVDWDAAITVDELDDETGLVGVWLHARDLGWL